MREDGSIKPSIEVFERPKISEIGKRPKRGRTMVRPNLINTEIINIDEVTRRNMQAIGVDFEMKLENRMKPLQSNLNKKQKWRKCFNPTEMKTNRASKNGHVLKDDDEVDYEQMSTNLKKILQRRIETWPSYDG